MDQKLIDLNKLLNDMFPFGSKDPTDVFRIITDQPIIETQRTGYWIPVHSYEACGGDYEAWMSHGNPVAFHYCSECKEENEDFMNALAKLFKEYGVRTMYVEDGMYINFIAGEYEISTTKYDDGVFREVCISRDYGSYTPDTFAF